MEQIEKNNQTALMERHSLAMERIHRICDERTVPMPFLAYFQKMAGFLIQMEELWKKTGSGETEGMTLRELQVFNHSLYEDILQENYETSYANPAYAVKQLGEVHGRILSFLYTELRGLIVYAYEQRLEETVIHLELFIEIYNCFEQDTIPEYKEIQQIVYWFVSDYSEIFVAHRVLEGIDWKLDFATRIIMESDLEDLRYLYRYGEYISEDELQTAQFLNSLSEEEIGAMADTYTEGYRIGFVVGGKDLSKKTTVNIRYHLGFERMIRRAIQNFEKMGLKPVIYRSAVSCVNRKPYKIGYTGACANPQYDYDHRADQAVYFDKKFSERRLGVMRTVYENHRTLAAGHAGPAVVEVFGELPFSPLTKPEAYRFSEKQQKLRTAADQEAMQLVNQYIRGEERSFTIIAFPMPEIGEHYPEIFRETIKINTLDYRKYQRIQQKLIDELDQGVCVAIKGCGANRTNLTVALAGLHNPETETLFENCVADVNIPVGEVFTSPRLAGTNGILHVPQVYLGELNYLDLELTFEDGRITAYHCANFDSEEENQQYLKENLLFHHDTLPLGEFAIGTNTAAYAMARRYQIADRLPILIAEKMGPHFAVGDTCYSWQEDTPVYNQDGKEIIARDNEISIRRKENLQEAYFGCHTDITIPYEEIDSMIVRKTDGTQSIILSKGRFVLEGTEELNASLEEA